MKRLSAFFIGGIFLLSQSVFSAGEDDLQSGMVNPGYHEKPAWFKESFLDIREDVDEAAAEGRQLMLYFYQDGCPYCAKLLQDNFGSAEISTKTQQYFDTIAVNMWGDREITGLDGRVQTEKEFTAELQVQYTPTLVFLDAKGNLITRLNGYYPPHKFSAVLDYIGGGKGKGKTFSQYYASLSSEPASGKLHRETFFLPEPLKLADHLKVSQRPLLVFFEQRQCKACDELHDDILSRPEVAASLSGFDVALVDIWSKEKLQTPTGKTLTARDWAKQMNIQYTPGLVFFDSSGAQVFSTEGYLKSFHLHAALDYVVTGAYKFQPNFQRYIQRRAMVMEALGVHVDLMQ